MSEEKTIWYACERCKESYTNHTGHECDTEKLRDRVDDLMAKLAALEARCAGMRDVHDAAKRLADSEDDLEGEWFFSPLNRNRDDQRMDACLRFDALNDALAALAKVAQQQDAAKGESDGE